MPQEKIQPLIKKIYQSLKDGGITDHNIDTEIGTDPTHISIYPITFWEALFRQEGFKTVEIKHLHEGIYWCTFEKIKLSDGGADYFDKEYFEEGTKNGLVNSFNRLFTDGVNVADRLERLIPNIKKDWVIQEVGCAYGHTLKALKDRGYEYITGCDISKYAIAKGIKEFDINLHVRDVEKEGVLKLDKGNYDLIYSCITLEHIHPENVEALIKSLAESTEIGGYNYHAIDLLQGTDTTHYCIKPRTWWVEMFEKNGFKEIPLSEKDIKLNYFLFRRV